MKELPPIVLWALRWIVRIVTPFQVVLLWLAYCFFNVMFRVAPRWQNKRSVVIGVTETANLIHALGEVFPSRYTCILDGNPFYSRRPDFGPCRIWFRPFVGPVLLAYLANLSSTFFYISFTGFLADRRADFKFLRGRGKKIVTLFCGSDIRSLILSRNFFEKRGEDSYTNYLANTENPDYDAMVRKTAHDADEFSDLIFNWRYDQLGYLSKSTTPWPYIINLKQYDYQFDLRPGQRPVVLHAPSSSLVKGTPLVRAAIKKLQQEGYDFEYVELIRVPHERVMEQLGRSHIVLQEFYFLAVGVFGVEALARGNAVITAANCEDNPELPPEACDAWVVAKYWEVYDKLKMLLEDPALVRRYAERGREFVAKYYDLPQVEAFYREHFAREGIPFQEQ